MSAEEAPVPLPSAKPFNLTPNVTVQPPLSHCGHGPGLILIVSDDLPLSGHEKTLDPPPLQKWAEEGFVVAQIVLNPPEFANDLKSAVEGLANAVTCDVKEKIGVITYTGLPQAAQGLLDSEKRIAASVNYSSIALPGTAARLWHVPSKDVMFSKEFKDITVHSYEDASEHFVLPAHENYKASAAAVAHTRTLAFLKPLIGGPYFDLEAIWEEHTLYEFGERAVEKTMGTMVQEPYVNHIPTITGGIGREKLTYFYRHHFVFNNPKDTALELVSRTVGVDRVIDEFVFKCTHDMVIDWLAPGIPPTGQKLEVPFTCVINIRGDRLYHEHIAWDQGTLLKQLGLLPEWFTFPYKVDGKDPAPGKKFEYKLPVAGVEGTRKLMDENSVVSNEMFKAGIQIREVDI